MKKIGILGGSGAFGSVHLLNRIFAIATEKYGATKDSDFPYLVMYNSPFDGLNSYGQSTENTYLTLLKHAKEMESIGCNTIVIACNTHHQYYNKLKNDLSSNTHLINILELLALHIHNYYPNTHNFTILCSQTSLDINLHLEYLVNKTIYYPEPKIQSSINFIIDKVISNQQNLKTNFILNITLNSLIAQQKDTTFIVACTELSILNKNLEYPTIDTLELLAEYINLISFKGSK